MTKRSRIILLVFTLLTILALKWIGYYRKEDKGPIGFFGRLLNTTNHFHVTYDGVDKKHIDIIWLTEAGALDTLVQQGTLKSNFGYVYGSENFSVFYKGQPLCTDGFFSTNNNVPHDVEIHITKTNTTCIVSYFIDGRKTTPRISNIEP